MLGASGTFTRQVLSTLIAHAAIPVAFIHSGQSPSAHGQSFGKLDIEINLAPDLLTQTLQEHDIPQWFEEDIEIGDQIRQLDCDFLLVACWPRLITDAVISSVKEAAVNLHPSLLPRFRGADPVSDQLSSDDRQFGVSLHLLNGFFDRGDIVLQQTFTPEKYERDDIERKAADIGAQLFIAAVNSYHQPGWQLTKQTDSGL